MPRHEYYFVEGYVVRMANLGSEYLTPDGRWLEYGDRWDVVTNGRRLHGGEQEALEVAQKKFEQNKDWWEEHKAQWKAES